MKKSMADFIVVVIITNEEIVYDDITDSPELYVTL